MASSTQYLVHAHLNGETYSHEIAGFVMRNTQVVPFLLSKRATFTFFIQRLHAKIAMGPIANIIYQCPSFNDNNIVKFYEMEIENEEDVQDMFTTHEYSGLDSIELYITLQVGTQETHVVQ